MDGDTELTGAVIKAAIIVHRTLGPGLLESVYETCLAHELSLAGILVERQIKCPVIYRGQQISCGYRLDLLIENSLIVEVKTVTQIHPVHAAQLLTYLRLRGAPLGLLLNFHTIRMVDGIQRVINPRAMAYPQTS